MNDKITIRSSVSNDARSATYLIYLTMGRLADYLFGFDDHARTRDVLTRLFLLNNNRFSGRFADVAVMNEKVAALLLSYPSRLMNRLALPTAMQLSRIYGWPGMLRFLRNAMPLIRNREAGRGEYFIDAVAVQPEFEGQGIGTALLTYAEEKARKEGLTRCSLTVDIANDRARGLYQHLGYQVVETVRIERLQQRIDYQGYYRMAKDLGAA